MRYLAIAVIVCFLAQAASAGAPAGPVPKAGGDAHGGSKGAIGPDPFPLATGAEWIYQAKVKWEDSGKEKSKTLSWTTSIDSVVVRGEIVLAKGTGLPSQLTFYDEKVEPAPFVMVKVGAWKLFVVSAEDRISDIWKKAVNPDEFLGDILQEGDLLLDLPLVEGKFYGETAQLTRGGTSNLYLVEGRAPFEAGSVKGLAAAGPLEELSIILRTNPDHSIWKFVPGLGFSGFEYVHHGTTSEVDCRLKEVRAGR